MAQPRRAGIVLMPDQVETAPQRNLARQHFAQLRRERQDEIMGHSYAAVIAQKPQLLFYEEVLLYIA